MTVEFKETPLKEVIAQFRRHLQINVRLDEAKLTDEGVQADSHSLTFFLIAMRRQLWVASE